MESISGALNFIYQSLLYLTNWPLAVVLLLGGFYFTWRTRLIQTQFAEAIRIFFWGSDGLHRIPGGLRQYHRRIYGDLSGRTGGCILDVVLCGDRRGLGVC